MREYVASSFSGMMNFLWNCSIRSLWPLPLGFVPPEIATRPIGFFQGVMAGILFLGATPTSAENLLQVESAWAHALPSVARNGAVYLRVNNHGEADRLVSVSTRVAERVELHTSSYQDGLLQMHHLPAVEIAEGEEIEFKPGEHHLMLINLHAPLRRGEKFPVSLVFEKYGTVEVMVRIK